MSRSQVQGSSSFSYSVCRFNLVLQLLIYVLMYLFLIVCVWDSKAMNVFFMLGTTMRLGNTLQFIDLRSQVIERYGINVADGMVFSVVIKYVKFIHRLLVITILSWGLVILHMTATLAIIIYLLIILF